MQISSTNVADVQPITIEGLDENGIYQSEVVTLTGQTPVTLTKQWSYILRGWNSGSLETVGNVFLSDDGAATTLGRPDVSTTIRMIIRAAVQQTQMALYKVPSDSTLYITHGWAHVSKAITTEVEVSIWKRDPGGIFRMTHPLALSTSGSQGDHRPYIVPIPFEAGTTLVYRAKASANSTAVSAGFHGIVIKN